MPSSSEIDHHRTGAPQAALWRQRRFLFGLAIALCLALGLILADGSWDSVLFRLLTDGGVLVIWLLSAFGWGALALRAWNKFQDNDSLLQFVSATSLGLGILWLITFCIGTIGRIDRPIAWGIIAIGVILAGVRLVAIVRSMSVNAARTSALIAPRDYLLLLLIPLASVVTVCAFVPPGVLWGDEPNGYDVLEYHLQLPREWFEAGRITTSTRNVFSYMPLAVETHYLLAMELRGGPWKGMYLAQLMHLSFCALAALAVYAFARAEGSRSAPLAGLAFAACPWIALLAPVAYNEGGLLLFATCALGYALRAMRNANSIGPMTLAGIFTGFACATKLTAIPTLLIPIPLCALIAAACHGRLAHAHLRTSIMGWAAYVLAALIVFSPHLMRNARTAGNPVFPEAQRPLGHAHFTPTQTERWVRANHLPNPKWQSLRGRFHELGAQIVFDWRYAYALGPLAILSVFFARSRPQTLFLALLLLWLAVFWTFFTHLQSRFFVLAIPITAFLVSQIESRREQVGIASALVAIELIVSTIGMSIRFGDRVALFASNHALGIEDLKVFQPEQIASALDENRPLALAGDARAFLYQVRSGQLHYRTVFDVDVKPEQTVVDAWLTGAPPSSVVIVDPVELDRFSRTYYGIPAPPTDLHGPRDRPFILRN